MSVANEAPSVTFNDFTFTPISDEGGLVRLTGRFDDTGFTDSHVVTIDWGDGNIVSSNVPNSDIQPLNIGDRRFTATHRYADESSLNTRQDTYRISVTISDGPASDTTPQGLFIEEVVNVVPNNLTATLSSASVAEATTFTLDGSFIDPGILDSHVVSIDWGDGSARQIVTLPSIPGQQPLRTFQLQHAYPDNPTQPATTYQVRLEVTDNDEPLATPASFTTSITVTNVAPQAIVLSALPASIQENESVTLSASFIDPGLLDTHEVVIDWGDGSETTTIQLPAGFTVSLLNRTSIAMTQQRCLRLCRDSKGPRQGHGRRCLFDAINDDHRQQRGTCALANDSVYPRPEHGCVDT